MYKLHSYCRACGFGKPGANGVKAAPADKLIEAFDLGIQPLSNDFCGLTDEQGGYAPLKVMYCPNCSLAQLSVVVRPDILYSKYLYVTSQSKTMQTHFGRLSEVIRQEGECNSLLEIGSNDGTLLKYFAAQGIKVVGIDPAENLTESARKQGIPSVTGVFNVKSAQHAAELCPGGFDVILARHVFCHVDDWKEFVNALAIPAKKQTAVYIEVPYGKDLLERGEFDTIYHEHLSYLTVKSVKALLVDSPFRLQAIFKFPIHGGALLLELRSVDNTTPVHPSVAEFLLAENITEKTWADFSKLANQNIVALSAFIWKARSEGRQVVGLGASAKSTVWVNACHLTRKDMAFITDTTPQKLWKFSPGTDIPIVDEGALLRELPDYAVCFAWNFRDEILEKTEPARSKGVKLVFPVPKLEVV
jgi:novobiocin biosynthesis protein NovU/D-mycarose 3-C-methyltransferase